MSVKRFGRLGGSCITAFSSLTTTAPANFRTPYSAQSEGTKLIAEGENATSAAMNRVAAALQTNIEHLLGVMDSPSLREEVLEPLTTNGTTTYGFRQLADVPQGTDRINLGMDGGVGGDTDVSPVAWVYVGLHKDSLGAFVRLYRTFGTADVDDIRNDMSAAHAVTPVEIAANEADANIASYYHPINTLDSSPRNSIPKYLPYISMVASDVYPYEGSPQFISLSSWQEDGPLLSTQTLAEYHVRPGCYLQIAGGDKVVNTGLFRVADIRKSEELLGGGTRYDKAVLTRGGLTRVTVEDGAGFTEGHIVSWRPLPNETDAASTQSQRTLYAHVMRIVSRSDLAPTYPNAVDLYLTTISGADDSPVRTVDGATPGVSYKQGTDAVAIASYTGRDGYAYVGQADKEVSSPVNAALVNGTCLYHSLAYPSDDAPGNYSVVLEVVPADYPVVFDTTSVVAGVAYPCSPPGFLLNPVLMLDTGYPVTRGRYFVWAHTLTTVREKLLTQGSDASPGTVSDPGTVFSQTGEDEYLLAALKNAHVGYAPVDSTDTLNGPYAPVRQVLGEDLWRVTLDQGANPDTYEVASGTAPGDVITFEEATLYTGKRDTQATVVAISGNVLVVGKVTWFSWDLDVPRNTHIDDPVTHADRRPISTSYRVEVGLLDYPVLSVDAAPMLDSAQGYLVPTFGLNAAYHCDYDANRGMRGQLGQGNVIDVLDTRPFTLSMEDAASGPAVNVACDSIGTAYLLRYAGKTGGLLSYKAGLTYIGADGALNLWDANTLWAGFVTIPLSSSTFGNLPQDSAQSIVESMQAVGHLRQLADNNQPYSGVVSGVDTTCVIGAASFSITEGYVFSKGPDPYSMKVLKVDALVYNPTTHGAVRYLYYDVSTSSFADTGALPIAAEDVLIATFATDGGGLLTSFTQLFTRTGWSTDREDVYVVANDSPYLGTKGAGFRTLSDAFAGLAALRALSLWPDSRKRVIRIAGPINEGTLTSSITMPFDGITVEGATPDANVAWAGDVPLFDFAGKSLLQFRNFTCTCQCLKGTLPATPSRVLFTSSLPGGYGWTIEGVHVEVDSATYAMNGYAYFPRFSIASEGLGNTAGGASETGTLGTTPVEPGTVSIEVQGCENFVDADIPGELVGDAGGSGTVDYTTGDVTLTPVAPYPVGRLMSATYGYGDARSILSVERCNAGILSHFGVYACNLSKSSIVGSNFELNGTDATIRGGIMLSSAYDVRVVGNSVTSAVGYGVTVYSGTVSPASPQGFSDRVLIDSNNVSYISPGAGPVVGTAYMVAGAIAVSRVNITGNTASSSHIGIHAGAAGTVVSCNEISSFTLNVDDHVGVYVDAVSCKVLDNSIYVYALNAGLPGSSAEAYGVRCTALAASCLVRGNSVTSNSASVHIGDAAYGIRAQGDDVTVTDNELAVLGTSAGYGAYMTGERVSVRGNNVAVAAVAAGSVASGVDAQDVDSVVDCNIVEVFGDTTVLGVGITSMSTACGNRVTTTSAVAGAGSSIGVSVNNDNAVVSNNVVESNNSGGADTPVTLGGNDNCVAVGNRCVSVAVAGAGANCEVAHNVVV